MHHGKKVEKISCITKRENIAFKPTCTKEQKQNENVPGQEQE